MRRGRWGDVRELENEEKNFSLRQELMCTASIGQRSQILDAQLRVLFR